MSNTFDFKKIIPHIAAVLIFIAITLAYFNPLLGGKKQLQQGDIQHYQGMSKEIADYRAQTGGKEALWTNSMFGGMPAYQISVIYHGNLLKYVNNVLMLGLPHPSGYVFLYMLGFFILLLTLKVDPWLSIVGAIAFGFSSYFFIILEAGHNSKAHAISFMAPVVAGFILSFRGKYLLGGALAALFLGLELFANHLQITYYLAIFLVVYSLAEFISSILNKQLMQFMKGAGVLLIAGLLAVLPNITNIWATYEYGKYTTRGGSDLTINENGKSNAGDKTDGLNRSYATGWSYGQGETMTLMIPNFKGGASEQIAQHHADALKEVNNGELKQYVGQMDEYFGDQPFTSGPVYAGSIIVFLFVLGLFIVKGPVKWAIAIATLLSIMLAWGSNYMSFTNFFFDHVPGYNKFRAVSMILVIAEFTLPLLGILALDQLLKSSDFFHEKIKAPFVNFFMENKKAFFISFGLTGGLCLLFLLMPGLNDYFKSPAAYTGTTGEREQLYGQIVKQAGPETTNQLLDGIESARKSIFKSDVWRSFIFITLAAMLVFLYAIDRVHKNVVILCFGLFVLIDMMVVDKRYLNDNSFVPKAQVQTPYTPTAADLQILEDKDPDFRVLNAAVNTFNDASTSYFHKSIGGYHGAKLKRYQELIDFQISKNNQNVLNMLNTKYIITTGQGQDQQPVVVPNKGTLGNAWFVNEFNLVANADSEITALSHFDPARTAVVDKQFEAQVKGLSPGKDSTSLIRLTHYEPNDLQYETSNKNEGLAVFSEIYYEKGWNAYVNGTLMPHFRANYVLRAMRLPAGNNKVEFKFEPKVYATGEKISMAGSILLLLVCAGSGFLLLKKP
ncbi:MAG: YfhO family protein [Bacteroidia bacterium]